MIPDIKRFLSSVEYIIRNRSYHQLAKVENCDENERQLLSLPVKLIG